jgi:hypothetical protein
MENAEPTRTKERTERELEELPSFLTDRLPCNTAAATTLKDEPMRAKFRSDKDEPRMLASKTESL